jgi:hypothetical protein
LTCAGVTPQLGNHGISFNFTIYLHDRVVTVERIETLGDKAIDDSSRATTPEAR